MYRRAGLTLTEVLVTLGILALGILAILTLFPLAASQMAIAVRENRSAQAALAADSFFRAYWKTEIVDRARDGLTIMEPFYHTLTDGGGAPLPPALDDEASYPVVVDPFGYASRNSLLLQNTVGDAPGMPPITNLRRRTLGMIGDPSHPRYTPLTQFPLRLCSLPDGLGYDEYGRPNADREYRYNWLWVVQRPLNRNRFQTDLTVVVFDRRPYRYAPPGMEAVYSAHNVTPLSSTVILDGITDLKPGNWIMDATITNPATTGLRIRHANFYQVVSVTEFGNQTALELQTPIKVRSDGSKNPYDGTFVVFRGVCGVSVRPPLTSVN